jgi:hypothetical protein
MASMKKYIFQFLIAIDQVFNTLLFGYADETLSARAWRAEQKGKFFGKVFRPTIDFIMFFHVEHCKLAHESEVKRRHLPPEMRP